MSFYNIAKSQTCTPPSKPTGLTATAISSSQINLSWNAVSGAIGYDLSYCDGTYISFVSGTSYSHTGRVANTTYSYKVQAQKSSTCVSGFTSCASATTPAACTPPAKPTGLTATAVSSSQINLSWNAVSGAIGYDVSYCDGTYIGYVTGTSYSHTGRVENTTYSYKVQAQKSSTCVSGFTTCASATTPSIVACTNVTITAQPQSQTKTVGSIATFSVAVNGTAPFQYLWYKNDTQITGATSSSYTTPTLTTANNGDKYYCIISNCNNKNQVITNTALLTVNDACVAASISEQPKNQSANIGSTTTFSIAVSGTPPFSYTWYKNGAQIQGANNSFYTTPTLVASDNGNTYYCKISNCNGTSQVSSANVTLTLVTGCVAVTINNTLVSQSSVVGGKVTWTVSTNGTAPFTYQWYKNGSPISGQTNSSYTTPTLTLSDNGNTYYCYVTNCSNSKNAKSNTASLSVTNNPSLVTINNANTIFSNPKNLWSGKSNEIADTIKICADGSDATQIIFENNTGLNSDNIRFWIASDQYGSNSDISGYFRDSSYNIDGNKITAKFTHPKYLHASYKPFRSDAIQIVDYTQPSKIIYSIPIKVYRAPVIMVHGLWGDPSSFSKLKEHLDNNNYYLPSFTKIVNYQYSNDASFYENRKIVSNDIIVLLGLIRREGYSAGKVDVIGHSMGGIISRYYLQSNDYKQRQDIHKLITINSPHSGSPWGNLFFGSLLNVTTHLKWQLIGEEIVKAFFNGSIHNGAVKDLAIKSNAMDYLNNTSLNNEVVPSHTIITTCRIQDFVDYLDNDGFYAIYKAISPAFDLPIGAFVSELLFNNELNDLVVAESSQSGGLPQSATTNFVNQFHIGSPSNLSVMNEVTYALNTNPTNANYFTQSGFSPTIINIPSQLKNANVNKTVHILVESVKISYPMQNQNFNQGDMIPISINSSNGVNRIIFEGINNASGIFIKDTLLSNGIINYKVPSNAFGQIKLIAFGYASNEFMSFDTLSININQSATIDSISSNLDRIYVQVDDSASISVSAYFNGGNKYLLTNQSGMLCQIADGNIAGLSGANFIIGKEVGNTTVLASYLGKFTTIPVTVIPRDTLSSLVTSVKNPIIENNPKNGDLLKVFPNPNSGEFTIQLDTKSGESIIIEVFNQFGQRIFWQQDMSSSDIFSKTINLEKIVTGIYFVRVKTKSNNYSEKIILID